MSAGGIRVLLVDDQPLLRAGVRTILETEPGIIVVGEAGDGLEAITAAEQLQPQVICMDVQMPVLDGIAATERIRSSAGGAPGTAPATAPGSAPVSPPAVIILTTFHREDYLLEALRAGASGFLLKNAGADELIRGIRAAARGDAVLSPEVSRTLIDRVAVNPQPDARLESLTAREREVLGLVAQGRSNAEIAAELFVGEATVKTHVSGMLLKLGLRDRIQAVVYAYESGLVRPGG